MVTHPCPLMLEKGTTSINLLSLTRDISCYGNDPLHSFILITTAEKRADAGACDYNEML